MIILGVDPGLERVGYGVILREGSRLTAIDYGLIETPRILLHDRLRLVHEQFSKLVQKHRPDTLATERLLFSVNRKTAMDVAKSLGVLLLVGSQENLPWCEYTPPEIKLAVVGTGAAEKRQVEFMVTRILGLEAPPKPDDVADALAVAICHAFRAKRN